MSEVAKQMIDKPAEEKRKQALERAANPYAQGTRYYDLYENNPYAPDKFTRQQTVWDRLANSFGMRSSYDAAQDEWAKAASEYDAQIAQLKGEDEYNSEAAKAERMRAAGLNPDLQGLGEASEAGEFAQEQTSPDINRNSEDVDRVLGAMQAIPQGITFAMSLADKAMGTMKLIYDLKEKKADFGKKLQDMATSFIENFMQPGLGGDEIGRAGERKERLSFEDTKEEIQNQAILWAKAQGFTKKEQKRFSENVQGIINGSGREKFYNMYTNLMKARKQAGETYTSKYTPKHDDEEAILSVVGELVNKWDTALLHNAEAERAKAENENKYQNARNPELEANLENATREKDLRYQNARNPELQVAAENAEYTEKKGHGKLVASARKSIEEAMKQLKQYTGDGNLLAIGLESVLAMLQLKYLE